MRLLIEFISKTEFPLKREIVISTKMIPRNRLLPLPWQACLACYSGEAGDNPKYTFKKSELRLQNSSKSLYLKGFTDAIAMQKAAPTVAFSIINTTASAAQVLISQLKFSHQPGDFYHLDQIDFELSATSFY